MGYEYEPSKSGLKSGNTTYFFDQAVAETKGFRACKKCHPHEVDPRTIYPAELIAAGKIFEDELEQNIGIQSVATKIGVSDRTLCKLFDRHPGVSPKRFLNLVAAAFVDTHLVQTNIC